MCKDKRNKKNNKKSIVNPNQTNVVCRAFTFYNRYYFDVKRLCKEVAYTTLGFFDGFNTQRVELSDSRTKNEPFYQLWKTSEQIVTKSVSQMGNQETKISREAEKEKLIAFLNAQSTTNAQTSKLCEGIDCSFQNIFGFSIDEDENFWPKSCSFKESLDVNYPITFVVLLQSLSKIDSLSQEIKNIKKELSDNIDKSAISGNVRFKLCSYATIDKFDIVICIKANAYKNIMNAISAFCCGENGRALYRTYTVVALNNSYIKENSLDEIKNNVIEEYLDSVCIKGVFMPEDISQTIKKSGITVSASEARNAFVLIAEDYLKSKLCSGSAAGGSEVFSYSMIGDEDVRFMAHNIELSRFIKLFGYDDSDSEVSPLFSPQFGFCRFDSDINCDFYVEQSREIAKKLNVTNRDEPSNNISRYSMLLRQMVTCVILIIQSNSKFSPLIKPIYQLQKAFEAMEKSPSRAYEYYSLYFAFFSILVHIYNYYENPEGTTDIKKLEEFNVSILRLLYQVSSTHLVAMRSDIRTFQLSNFHVNLYYAPSKLRAFYSAFIYDLVNYYHMFYNRYPKETPFQLLLGNSANLRGISKIIQDSYTFIICPGLYTRTTVEEVVGDFDNNRIMLCKMPEENLYRIKSTMIQLAHEVCHHGLYKVRRREDRFYYYKNGYYRAITSYYKLMLFWELKKSDTIASVFEIGRNGCGLTDDIYHFFESNLVNCFESVLSDPELDKVIFMLIQDRIERQGKFDKYKESEVDKKHYYKRYMMEAFSSAMENICAEVGGESLSAMISNYISNFIIKEFRASYEKSKEQGLKTSLEVNIGNFIEEKTKHIFSYSIPKFINDSHNLRDKYRASFNGQYVYLFDECFSDLISILTLKVSFCDYLRVFNEELEKDPINASNTEKDTTANYYWKLLNRILIIIKTMDRLITDDDKGMMSHWNLIWPHSKKVSENYIMQIGSIFKGYSDLAEKIKNATQTLWYTHIDDKLGLFSLSDSSLKIHKIIDSVAEEVKSESINDDEKCKLSLALITVRDKDVIFRIVDYLVTCGKSYFSSLDPKSTLCCQNIIDEINIDGEWHENRVHHLVLSINDYLNDFESKMC